MGAIDHATVTTGLAREVTVWWLGGALHGGRRLSRRPSCNRQLNGFGSGFADRLPLLPGDRSKRVAHIRGDLRLDLRGARRRRHWTTSAGTSAAVLWLGLAGHD